MDRRLKLKMKLFSLLFTSPITLFTHQIRLVVKCANCQSDDTKTILVTTKLLRKGQQHKCTIRNVHASTIRVVEKVSTLLTYQIWKRCPFDNLELVSRYSAAVPKECQLSNDMSNAHMKQSIFHVFVKACLPLTKPS